jgi:hypothetical protein
MSHAVAFEAYELVSPDDAWRVPSSPTYVFRRGLVDQVDMGIRAVNMGSFGVDLKYNFVQSDVDLAVDPGFQFAPFTTSEEDDGVIYTSVDVPLLVGLNVAPELTIQFGGGLSYIYGDGFDQPVTKAISDEALFVRGSAGLDLRISQRFAIHPAFSLYHALDTDEVGVMMAGCGFRIGGPIYEGLLY